MFNVIVPSPGESVLNVQIAAWLVADGDNVEKNQEIAEIDSDKATLSIYAEISGVIKIIVETGSQAAVGDVIATIEEKVLRHSPSSEEKPKVIKPQKTTESSQNQLSEKSPHHSAGNSEGKLSYTPLARALMEAEGLSDSDIIDLLRNHKITKNHILELKERAEKNDDQIEPKQHPSEIHRAEHREKMSTLRTKLSQRLVKVKNETALLTTFNEVDMSEVLRIRDSIGSAFEKKYGQRLGLMSFFTRAAAIALIENPRINAFIDNDEIVYHQYADISIAVSTPKGLMVPVVRNAHLLSIAEMEASIRKLAEKARTNKITLDEMSGGTFTVTNGGVFGSMLSTPIINPPQSAILGMHNIVERPVAIQGKVEIRPIMYVALSYDHRLIDGSESVRFLIRVKELIENPLKMLMGEAPLNALLGL